MQPWGQERQGGVTVGLKSAAVRLQQVTCKKWVYLKGAWLPSHTSFMVSPGNESVMRLWSLSIRVTLKSSPRLSLKVTPGPGGMSGTGTLKRREFHH